MAAITHDQHKTGSSICVNGQPVLQITLHDRLCRWQPTEQAAALGLALQEGQSFAAQPIYDSLIAWIERQMARLELQQELTATEREPLHPDLHPYLSEMDGFGHKIQHPLLYAVPYWSDDVHRINAQYSQTQNRIARARAASDWAGYVFAHERPYRFNAFYEVRDRVSDKEYWDLLGSAWIDSENIHENLARWRTLWRSKRPGRERMLDEDEQAAFAALPNFITIYRGTYPRANMQGMSWTVNKKRALIFAHRFRHSFQTPYLGTARVRKENVLAFFLSRGEEEIVLDPADLIGLRITVAPKQNSDRKVSCGDLDD